MQNNVLGAHGRVAWSMQARVLGTCEGGIVVQFLHSNAVLRCKWPTGDVKPEQIKYREMLISQLKLDKSLEKSLEKSRSGHKRAQIVTLRVQRCAPPELTVEVASVEQCAHGASAQQCAGGGEGPQRKRQFLGRLA